MTTNNRIVIVDSTISDGYVPIYNSSQNKFISSSTGATTLKQLHFNSYTPISINNIVYTAVGIIKFDKSSLDPVNTGTRTIKLKVIAEMTAGDGYVQLYNVTAASVVTLTPSDPIHITSLTPTELLSNDISANLSLGPAIYQVQAKATSGNTITVSLSELLVEWS